MSRLLGTTFETASLVSRREVGCRLWAGYRHRDTVHGVLKAFEARNRDARLTWWCVPGFFVSRFEIWSPSPTTITDLIRVLGCEVHRAPAIGGYCRHDADDGSVIAHAPGPFDPAEETVAQRMDHIRRLLRNGRLAEAEAETNRLCTAMRA